VRHLLESTAVDLGPPGRDDDYGQGRLDAAAALAAGAVPAAAPLWLPAAWR
jgi:hypothetical protein